MEICSLILNNQLLDSSNDFIELSYDERFLRRKKLSSNNGMQFLVNLEKTTSLKLGDFFKLENGLLVAVKFKKEELLEIKSDNLINLVWHIGNRHIPCQIEKIEF